MCRQEPHQVQQRRVQSPEGGQEGARAPGEAAWEQPGSTAPWHGGRQTLSQAELSQQRAPARESALPWQQRCQQVRKGIMP